MSPQHVSSYPTAVHSVEVGHDTPVRLLVVAPGGSGVDCAAHWDPFQRSATVTAEVVPGCEAPTVEVPTVVHASGAEHETSFRETIGEPAGLAACCTTHPLEAAPAVFTHPPRRRTAPRTATVAAHPARPCSLGTVPTSNTPPRGPRGPLHHAR